MPGRPMRRDRMEKWGIDPRLPHARELYEKECERRREQALAMIDSGSTQREIAAETQFALGTINRMAHLERGADDEKRRRAIREQALNEYHDTLLGGSGRLRYQILHHEIDFKTLSYGLGVASQVVERLERLQDKGSESTGPISALAQLLNDSGVTVSLELSARQNETLDVTPEPHHSADD